jgi:hypothetical protein
MAAEKLLSEVPTPVKTLEFLRKMKPGKFDVSTIAKELDEPESEVKRALSNFDKKGIIIGETFGTATLYHYQPSKETEDAYNKIVNVYSRIGKVERLDLLLLGLLAQDGPLYRDALCRGLESDKYTKEEIEELLTEKQKVGKVKIEKKPVYKGERKKDGKEKVTADLEAIYAKEIEKDKLTRQQLIDKALKDYKEDGFEGKVYEEDFILAGDIPPKILEFAKEYLQKEGKGVTERVDKEKPLRYAGKD